MSDGKPIGGQKHRLTDKNIKIAAKLWKSYQIQCRTSDQISR